MDSRQVVVLMMPYPSRETKNSYVALLIHALEREGVRVEPFSIRRILRGRMQAVHLHWPDSALASPSPLRAAYDASRRLVSLFVAGRLRARIVWTAHNLNSHDRHHPLLERLFWALFIPQVDAVVSLSRAGIESLVEAHPKITEKVVIETRHGEYLSAYGQPVSRGLARQSLDLPDAIPIVAFIGQVRRYKGIDSLIKAHAGMTNTATRLLIAGNCPDQDLEDELKNRTRSGVNIEFRPGYIPDSELALFLASVNLVVLPYQEVLNSGAALLSLSYRRPILVPRTRVFEELRTEVGETWVHCFDGDLSAEVLTNVSQAVAGLAQEESPNLSRHCWSLIARQTKRAYFV